MMERIAISLEKKLLDQFDRLMAGKGYSNRSEAVRDLIREKLVEREWAAPAGETVATVLLVYEHDTMELSQKLASLEHKEYRRIVAGLHIHMDPENCLEILVLRGPGKTIQRLGERLISLRGVKHGRFIPGTVGARI
jgi:CopG family nickel-responsive transcriptional regulator